MNIQLLTPTKPTLFVILASLAAGASLHGGVIYSETFDSSGTNSSSATIGWEAYATTSATDLTNVAPNAGDRIGISSLTGNPSSDGFGYYFASNASTGTQDMIWAGFEDGLSLSNVDTITWMMGNSNTTASVQLLVQVGGSWYVSAEVFSNSSAYTSASNFSSADASAVAQQFTYSTDAALWLDFTLTPDSTMSIGSVASSDLASSPITGIGFYFDSNNTANTTIRLDTLQVTNIPEPATFAFLCGSVALLTMLARRRRK
ncbi:hypothetical protein [Coraliomargarita parva]|uniref:hypothetical protein n=1 Tax=Coraliomargarita parva TaxID=3014050 RepID=UPI0022B59E6A|nr:hypothetical protein [Coraliomargarita parva]